jgi:hypothetical protein
MEKKQTAVEWLYHQIVIKNSDVLKFRQYLEQAKEMEKEQVIEAFKHGELPPIFVNYNAEQYYNETYGSK